MSSKKLAFIIASTFLVSTTLPLVAVAKMQPIDHYQSAMYQLISDHNGNDNGNSNNGGSNGNSNGNGNDGGGNGNGNGNGNGGGGNGNGNGNGNGGGGNGNGNGNGNWS